MSYLNILSYLIWSSTVIAALLGGIFVAVEKVPHDWRWIAISIACFLWIPFGMTKVIKRLDKVMDDAFDEKD